LEGRKQQSLVGLGELSKRWQIDAGPGIDTLKLHVHSVVNVHGYWSAVQRQNRKYVDLHFYFGIVNVIPSVDISQHLTYFAWR